MKVLSSNQIDLFHRKGYLPIAGLLAEEYALKIQSEIWEELEEEFGINKSRKETWRTPPHSPRKAKFRSTNKELINNKFRSIIDDLIGENKWREPKSWGGFLVNFPSERGTLWNLENKLWHWDYELFRGFELKGLLIFSFYSEVLPKGGGTLIVSGSHRIFSGYYKKLTTSQKEMKHGDQRKHFMKTHPYLNRLTDPGNKDRKSIEWFMDEENLIDGVPLQVIELTGDPGDVVFCHPRIIHAPAEVNLNDSPRIMRTKFLW